MTIHSRFLKITFAFFMGIIGSRHLVAQRIQELAVEKLKPGFSCEGITVFEGDTPKKFKVDIGRTTNYPLFDQERLILFEMHKKKTPIVAGMSGTPIYCGDKLVGALSFEMGPFSLGKSLGGITPIRAMRDQRRILGRKIAGQTHAKITEGFRPIAIPVFVSDINEARIERLQRTLPFRNFIVVPNGTVRVRPHDASSKIAHLLPGESVTMMFSIGAVRIGGTCTVTEVTDKTFSMCGHPVLGEGEIEIPAYRSSIAKSFFSSYYSYKVVEEILDPVGTIIYDNAFAVEGVRETRPHVMIPVHFTVTADSERYEYDFEVFRHKFYSSTIIEEGMRILLNNLWSDTRLGTAKLHARVFLKQREKPFEIFKASLINMKLRELEFLKGYADPWEILSDFQQQLETIQESEWNFVVERVEVNLDIWSGDRTLTVDSFALLDATGKSTDELHAGDELTMVVGLRNENATLKLAKQFKVRIPDDLKLVVPQIGGTNYLPAHLYLMEGSQYSEKDPKKLPKFQADSPEEFLQRLLVNQRDPSELFMELELPPEYVSNQKEVNSFPKLQNDEWIRVEDLEFLRERREASQPRVLSFSLGAAVKDSIVYVSPAKYHVILRLMLKK